MIKPITYSNVFYPSQQRDCLAGNLRREEHPSNRIRFNVDSNLAPLNSRFAFVLAAGYFSFFLTLISSTPIYAQVDFTKDVRPILAEKCYACHGPDDAVREAELRFDQPKDALATLPSGMRAIIPNDPANSELVRRIFHSDIDERMPPADSRKQLTDREREILKEWIANGASFDTHWSFQPVEPPDIPTASFPQWQRNSIDAFIGMRLMQAEMKPTPEADRVTLIRRLSFDLRGLPPTIEEVDTFRKDASTTAYEDLVRRFLKSEHFGEKLAIDWLDLARYGDTNGYHADSHRDVWLYRDWVIHALNSNMPFDQFVREQIAGDLLPSATDSQHIASGFNRNAPFNEEGGADPEEFSVVYAVDRANTTGQALLGLTFGCAQCHSHKYDPISHQEYYEFYAFFNSVEGEPGGGGENGHHGIPVPPTMAATSPLRTQQFDRLSLELKQTTAKAAEKSLQLVKTESEFKDAILEWANREKQTEKDRELNVLEGLVLHLDAADVDADGKSDASQRDAPEQPLTQWNDKSQGKRNAVATGKPRWMRDGFLGRAPAVQFDGQQDFMRTATGGELLQDGYTMVAAVSFEGNATHQMLLMWGDESQGKRRALWRTAGDNPTLSFNGYGADVVGNQPLPSGNAAVAYVFQKQGDKQVSLELNGHTGGSGSPGLSPYVNHAITIGANNAGAEKSNAAVGEVLIYDRALSSEERGAVGAYLAGKFSIETTYEAVPREIADIIATNSTDWTPEKWQTLVRYFVTSVDPDANLELRNAYLAITEIKAQLKQLKTQTTTMVMREMKNRNPAYILARGDFQQPGQQVQPNVPSILGRLPEGQVNTRLDLAEWLTRDDHPLVSRVRVNHLWKMLMGTGLVRTAGDFGTQGELPSHPELLDWLAHRFVESGWDTKELIFEIVTSATYRQQSAFNETTLKTDPQNRLHSQSPRYRLSAEEIRDMALASSGLLNRKIGGPSVRPFQPLNYFSANSGQKWPVDKGLESRRRGLYTYLQRTAPFPAHLIFDAPSRQICTAVRPRTNTPLQALVMMNDPLFLEAAGSLAQKTLEHVSEEQETQVSDRARFLFRSVLSRFPTDVELRVLESTFNDQLEIYAADNGAAEALIDSAELSGSDHPNATLAAWTNVASIVLNLDEAITRE